jgi:hypothetical protein
MKHSNSFAAVLGAAATMIGGSAYAAPTQGTLGATSTGVVNLSATVPNKVQITGLSDVTLSNLDPSAAASSAQNVCVWSNTGTKGYNIKATGSGTSGAFTLANSTFTVPYSVEWSGSSGATSGMALTAATVKTGFTSTAVDPTCASAPTTSASLILKFTAADLQSMRGGQAYTGSLTLLVAPE